MDATGDGARDGPTDRVIELDAEEPTSDPVARERPVSVEVRDARQRDVPPHDVLGEGHALAAMAIGMVALGLPRWFVDEQLLVRGGRGSLQQARHLLERYADGDPHVAEAEALLRGVLVGGHAHVGPDDGATTADARRFERTEDEDGRGTVLAPPVFGGPAAAPDMAAAWSAHPPAVGYSCRAGDPWVCQAIAPQLDALLGISAAAWVADPDAWLDLTHPEDRERLLVERFRAVSEHRRFVLEYRLIDSEGNYRWVRDEAALEERGDGVVVAHGLLLDLTDRHRSDRALSDRFERCLEQLRAQRRELRERHAFVRLLAHDLRSPLSTIRGSLQTIVGFGPELPAHRRDELLVRAERAAGRGLDLVHQLLEVDRWEGITVIEPRRVVLASLAAQACEEAGLHPDRVQVRASEEEVVVDEVVVTRAVTNLLANADRFTSAEGQVRLRARRVRPGVVRFSIEDEGPGVPDVQKERIFQPYLTLDDPSGPSLGLGLSLVGVLAQLHGGQAWVEDLPEVGSVFHLEVREAEA